MGTPLSVAIVALNEERKLPACLASVAWADEIIVCDSGSNDRTREIAAAAGASTYRDEWRGFAAHKNLAVERCRNAWVLVLDADERVTPELREAIEGVLNDPTALDGYFIPRRNHFLGCWIRGGGWYPDDSLRLFHKTHGRFADRPVHEVVKIEGRVGRLTAPMDHFTYDSVEEFLTRMERYAALAAEELWSNGRRARVTDLTVRPLWTFIRMYGLQRGFVDGWRGLVLAGLYACYTFAKYAHLWERGARVPEA
ncbi:MAG TPA: glycosyltransferase family 2 protein [Candidatus Baltobacteraceae bacterium]|nr:glycosyltransferase family 2 protein [Candidatus Baltobacteraceae bacterium]